MPAKCARCNSHLYLDSELDDRLRSSMTGAIGYGFDPLTMIAFRCESCRTTICLRCALTALGLEHGAADQQFSCQCGGLMTRQ